MRAKGFKILMAAGMIAGLCFAGTGIVQGTPKSDWQGMDDGLQLGEFKSPQKSPTGAYPITVLKIDPNVYSLKLISASEHGDKSKTAKDWADAFRLVAAINASMYHEDHRTSTGYMKNFTHVNNRRINPKFGAFLAFNPLSPSLPPVQIIDRYEQDWEALIKNYHTVIQNYRMISLKGGNMWKPSDSIYSIAAVAMDTNGNVLFIHSRSPYSVHDFNHILLKLPLDIKNAMYVEGGPEATVYVNAGGKERAWVGSYETSFSEHDENAMLWRVPNIIGITRRE
ncbi:MAG: phosphodiester glycosidase family protein [Candidatus Desulfacyla sp.]